jgi:hypothetical protein
VGYAGQMKVMKDNRLLPYALHSFAWLTDLVIDGRAGETFDKSLP